MKSTWQVLPLAVAAAASLLRVTLGSPVDDAGRSQPITPTDTGMSSTCGMNDYEAWDNEYWKRDAYGIFVDHFSTPRTSTETYLYDSFKNLYPNTSIVITQTYGFDLLKYASSAEGSNSLVMRPLEGMEKISKIVYRPPQRRRDGSGAVGEAVTFAGYTIAWKEYEFIGIVAVWQEGFSTITQWHLIGETPKVAEELIHAVGSWNTKLREVILVFDNSFWYEDHSLWLSVQSASWKDVILDETFKKRVQHDYRSFFRSEKIYKDLEVPWKRGLIFLGPPGNGKTVSIKAIMKDVDVPILYVKSFHIGTIVADRKLIKEMNSIFERARREAPCVLIMEDLDSLITENNRSFFLNEVDGLEDNDGLLLIGTTNHFDRLDPALSNRPSRFDRKYNFPNPNRDERRAYALYWQKKLASNHEIDFPDSLLDEVADQTDKFSFAYLKEAFVSTLLTLAGREDVPLLQLPFRDILLEQIKTLRESLESGQDVFGLFRPEGARSGSLGRIWSDEEMEQAFAEAEEYDPAEDFSFGSENGRCMDCHYAGGAPAPTLTRTPMATATSVRMAESSKMTGKMTCFTFKMDPSGGPMTPLAEGEAMPTGLVWLSEEEMDERLGKQAFDSAKKEDENKGRFVVQA